MILPLMQFPSMSFVALCLCVLLYDVMNVMMKRIFVVLSNPFVILAIVNMLFACRIVWVIKNTCFLIHPGEIVYKFPLIEENYNVMIGGILMNIFFVGILLLKLRKKSIVEQYDLKCCMFYNIITFLLIAWGYWHLFDTIHDRIITEYNPLFQFWFKVMNMQFLGNPKYVMYVYGLLTTMLIGLCWICETLEKQSLLYSHVIPLQVPCNSHVSPIWALSQERT